VGLFCHLPDWAAEVDINDAHPKVVGQSPANFGKISRVVVPHLHRQWARLFTNAPESVRVLASIRFQPTGAPGSNHFCCQQAGTTKLTDHLPECIVGVAGHWGLKDRGIDENATDVKRLHGCYWCGRRGWGRSSRCRRGSHGLTRFLRLGPDTTERLLPRKRYLGIDRLQAARRQDALCWLRSPLDGGPDEHGDIAVIGHRYISHCHRILSNIKIVCSQRIDKAVLLLLQHLVGSNHRFNRSLTLGMIGFGDFAELNAMFTLRDFRMLLTFMGAVGVAGILFLVFRQKAPASVRIHKGIVPGAVLFGTGWAISGGCPSIPIVQLGTGYLPAIVTMTGIAVGMKAYRKLNARVFHFDAGACNV